MIAENIKQQFVKGKLTFLELKEIKQTITELEQISQESNRVPSNRKSTELEINLRETLESTEAYIGNEKDESNIQEYNRLFSKIPASVSIELHQYINFMKQIIVNLGVELTSNSTAKVEEIDKQSLSKIVFRLESIVSQTPNSQQEQVLAQLQSRLHNIESKLEHTSSMLKSSLPPSSSGRANLQKIPDALSHIFSDSSPKRLKSCLNRNPYIVKSIRGRGKDKKAPVKMLGNCDVGKGILQAVRRILNPGTQIN